VATPHWAHTTSRVPREPTWYPDATAVHLVHSNLLLMSAFENIVKIEGGPDTVRRCLAEALDVVWNQDIEGDLLENLWESIPKRVAAVLDANGWYTLY